MRFPNSLGIVEKNSTSYIKTVFEALSNGQVVIPLRSDDDKQRIDAVNVSRVVVPDTGGGWCNMHLDLPDSDEVAHVSFTSGTEGTPKGVFISQLALNDVVRRLQTLMKIDASVKEYIGVPVYHSFGYGRCRHIASVGGQFFIPETGFDPREVSTMLFNEEINSLSLVPSLLRVFIRTPELLGDERFNLKWLEIGSQPMDQLEKLKIRELFPNARIVQHYGLTEASRTSLLQIDGTDESLLESVGKAYGDVSINVSKQGRILIKGKHVASQIIKEGQINSVVNDEGWLQTSDLGELKDGYLYFQGRADNVVNCGGQKLSTEKLEKAIENALNISGGNIAVSAIDHELYGQGFLVSYVSNQLASNIEEVTIICLKSLGISAKGAIQYNLVEAFPVTHTGKIQHKKLVQDYRQQYLSDNSQTSELDELIKLFSLSLGIPVEGLNRTISIADIGIDSLQSIQLSIKLETYLGYLPPDWREQSIESLSRLPRRQSSAHQDKIGIDLSKSKARPLWDGSSNMNPKGIGFWALVKEDYQTHDSHLFSQGLFALFVHRFGNWRMGLSNKLIRFPMSLLYRLLRKLTQVSCGIKLDYTVHVGRRVKLEHFGGMILGAREIGDDVIIRQNTTFGIRDMSDLSAKPTIEQGVNIGAGAVIVGDITVGRYSIIGPNSVVTEDVPAFSIVSVGASVISQAD